jgi:predicted anti-sigma-YlaC factor YlaD
MTCEECQLATLDAEAQGPKGLLPQVAREHLLACPDCAAFERNWQELRGELQQIGVQEQGVQTPSRVEMRLRQEFRTKHKTMRARRSAVVAAWALAAAAILVVTIAWSNWSHEKSGPIAKRHSGPTQQTMSPGSRKAATVIPGGPELGEVLLASNNSEEFTLLPASTPGLLGDATVVHVQMQRGALGALGLTVNEEVAGDWIDVDLLLGDDGQPQAVRLPQSTN